VVNAIANANCYLFAVQMPIIFDWQFCRGVGVDWGGVGGVEVCPRTACCCQKYP